MKYACDCENSKITSNVRIRILIIMYVCTYKYMYIYIVYIHIYIYIYIYVNNTNKLYIVHPISNAIPLVVQRIAAVHGLTSRRRSRSVGHRHKA